MCIYVLHHVRMNIDSRGCLAHLIRFLFLRFTLSPVLVSDNSVTQNSRLEFGFIVGCPWTVTHLDVLSLGLFLWSYN